MTKIVCITSMDQNYYNRIGKLMLQSWSKRWFKDSTLVVYNEGFNVPTNINNIQTKNWNKHCNKDWSIFSKKTDSVPVKKFAKKGFAFLHGMKTLDFDLLIWIDADILFYQDVNKRDILNILPSTKLIAFFDTYYQLNPDYTLEEYNDPKRTISAAESGFVIVNKNHYNFNQFVKNYEKYYTAHNKPECLGNWYDGNICSASAFDFRHDIIDMSKFRTTNKTQTPLNYSWLGEYFRHHKGNVKSKLDLLELEKQLKI